MQVAVGRRDHVRVFGDDWDTQDGTGVRDYIHVIDLAMGHLAALDHLEPGCDAFNLGTGTGASVLEVIKTVENVTGQAVPYEVIGRRDGDIATLAGRSVEGQPEARLAGRPSLEVMLADSWRWQSTNPDGLRDLSRGPSPAAHPRSGEELGPVG